MSQNKNRPSRPNQGPDPRGGMQPGWGVPNGPPHPVDGQPRIVHPQLNQPGQRPPNPQQQPPYQPGQRPPNPQQPPYPPVQRIEYSSATPAPRQHYPQNVGTGPQQPEQTGSSQPNYQPVQGAPQLPVPVNYGQHPPQPVQYVVMPHPTYWGQPPQPAINMISAEEETRSRNWRRFLTLISLLGLAMLGLIWYGYTQGNLVAIPQGGQEALVDAPIRNLTTDARIQPARQAALSYPVDGIIQKSYIEDGEFVEAGQLLLSLDDSRQIVAVAQAQASLEQAQARLQEVETGARTQEVIAAQAAADAARARYTNLTADASVEDISAAEAQLAAAQAALQDLLNGPDPNAAIEAKAELQTAEAAVSRAQSAYDQVKWRNDVAMLPEAQALQEATTALEAARARSNQKLQGASAAEISQARAQVKEAEAELQSVRNPVAQGDIDAAAAELRSAEATLEMVESGNRSEVISFAQAEVSAANAALLEAEVALQETRLVAPYSGIVVELLADVGEFVTPGMPVLQYGDLTTLKFETELPDTPVIQKVDEGMPVLIKIEELGDLAMTGTVTSIKQKRTDGGDSVYTVFVEPDDVDERFTWKMRSQIYFQFE